MITLDQVKLLEQKIESAVNKITQLQAENDALRSKCSELTNALSAKSEQLSFLEQDQNMIESGILKALDRLNSIENSVLKSAGQAAAPAPESAVAEPAVQETAPSPLPVEEEPVQPVQEETAVPDFTEQTPEPVTPQEPAYSPIEETFPEAPVQSEPENPGFDIF